ncbi:hypothetical protein H112_03343 [Trichophyton rubrum D6]|uniref:Uncharacterized protein n=2 Tax=Trichophyton TaxID=5550 RepID=A0A022W5T0_TRIRU|nr:hypothetical protein H100_03347 [Trichophyton rubrum MR850]EZF43119.1 hypothetical protein H102_03342 [Trichophyton rubrum CBS 100081]EZF53785.1 hypothetical protein H103_03354 [Trichophyton rubrum CBS 288.86]EZF64407.1 hypothetical protein H104_03337 [Trichophyton rubrum CBS 289.86]EZF74995.1 hypothetical protein H105_03360 [Trichophyton soudanense CBS 452.61]EZF85701.1 hypothetical protein H110_03348 [Trichophyton rubrum MR1448]EZF96474.1 hypothetical protein H113_03358 [Trichophyton rub
MVVMMRVIVITVARPVQSLPQARDASSSIYSFPPASGINDRAANHRRPWTIPPSTRSSVSALKSTLRRASADKFHALYTFLRRLLAPQTKLPQQLAAN